MVRTLLKPLSFLPALLLMYAIYNFSAQPAEVSSQLSFQVSCKIVEAADYIFDANMEQWEIEDWATRIHFITRKLAHMTEYFALAVAVSFPLYVYGVHGIWLMLLAGLICVGFACGDEYHQSFVEGRTPSRRDIAIDSFGVFWGIILVRIIGWTGRKTIFRPRKKKVKAKKVKNRPQQDILYEQEPPQPYQGYRYYQPIPPQGQQMNQNRAYSPHTYNRNPVGQPQRFDPNPSQQPQYYNQRPDQQAGAFEQDFSREPEFFHRQWMDQQPQYFDREPQHSHQAAAWRQNSQSFYQEPEEFSSEAAASDDPEGTGKYSGFNEFDESENFSESSGAGIYREPTGFDQSVFPGSPAPDRQQNRYRPYTEAYRSSEQ